MLYILLQHFYNKRSAKIKAFSQPLDIENYMGSEIYTKINYWDQYAGKNIMQRVLIDTPNYDGVIGFIENKKSNGIIYVLDEYSKDNLKELYMAVEFDIDTCGNFAPWIKSFCLKYDGDNIINADYIKNINELDDSKTYIVLLKIV
jgi:hypothetical protein